MVFKSLSSLSENLLSWSAEVPLKKPEAMIKSIPETKRKKWMISPYRYQS